MKTIVIVLAIVLSGCGLANSHYLTYNFEKGAVMVANIGSEMMLWTDTYKNDVYGTIQGTFERALTYSGKQGNVIKIFYREVSNNFARPSFTQELTYDITSDSLLQFRNTEIKVVEVTNRMIKFVVSESPLFQWPNGSRIK
jgi:hypothetical protein